ncbi:diadenylate cyclase CdaA [Candidatus Atelocyanobacterium thalassae]|uniref:Diadenylate cyclase n=1 Tax=cyanobacterium endosymbiont of Braarudosphaera bigelowii TaxID=1285375 RepID=A0ABM7U4Z2_9CHRO|nr:diadenylate cyclase CdaA [Candidatus Atelocyanobacterium thalassa]BDA39754.1 cyclic di-AMP synthase CdaA [cyanobacterium endosymbiont of Braarudosphaera bigelowii]
MLGEPPSQHWITSGLIYSGIDTSLMLLLTYLMLFAIGERRTLWMVRGLIILMLVTVISEKLQLTLLKFVLEKLVLGAAVSMAVIFQGEFRRFLELLGRGKILQLFKQRRPIPKPGNIVDELVEAVRELSQNRTGALIVIETEASIDTRVFVDPGVIVNGEISKALLQTIFQPKTLLHDGAVFIRGSRIISAGVILPLSDKTFSRQLGTRHRAAIGITENIDQCLCIVVSEETGSISLAEKGVLDRPLTNSRLKELLKQRFSLIVDSDSVTPGWDVLKHTIDLQGKLFFKRTFNISSSNSPEEKK